MRVYTRITQREREARTPTHTTQHRIENHTDITTEQQQSRVQLQPRFKPNQKIPSKQT